MSNGRFNLRRILFVAAGCWMVLAAAALLTIAQGDRICAAWHTSSDDDGPSVVLNAPDLWPEDIVAELQVLAEADRDAGSGAGQVCIYPPSVTSPWPIAAIVFLPAALIVGMAFVIG